MSSYVVVKPHISEKGNHLGESQNVFVFKVSISANKCEIKKRIQELFSVEVEDVRVLNYKGKSRVFKGTKGKTKAFKKAYVKLKEGQDIKFLDN
ncbi:MAG: 50S ribosomal protein L23 [Thiotrichales bacterium]|nr:MAG: 50S ribosomal protein L23 [Thiotrichales bacterium]